MLFVSTKGAGEIGVVGETGAEGSGVVSGLGGALGEVREHGVTGVAKQGYPKGWVDPGV